MKLLYILESVTNNQYDTKFISSIISLILFIILIILTSILFITKE